MTPAIPPSATRRAQTTYDIAVIGGGVVGAAIARELAGYQLTVALVEARPDVGDGTSKANTAILHTGYDAKPGTLESRLVRRGHQLLGDYAARTGIPVERTGALLVAWTREELDALPGLKAKAGQNGYDRCQIIGASQIYQELPHLGEGALGALTVPDESIICTWTVPLTLATDARLRGTELLLNARVDGADIKEDATVLHTTAGDVRARYVVNAAGLGCDAVDRLFGYDRFTVTPRRGELLVFDKQARPLVNRIVLPVPTKRGKGVLVSPTIYGNVMLGPTAEDVPDKTATGTSGTGFEFLLRKGEKLIPDLLHEEVTASYAGLRAAINRDDYLIDADHDRRYLLVAGIRSTGLTSAMAIAEHVRDLLARTGLELTPRGQLPDPPQMPNIGENFPRPYQDAARIAADPAYGRVVCFCERVTAGEIRDAYRSPVPPCDLNGLRRRTRAMNGRCQGFYCGAEILALAGSRGDLTPLGPRHPRDPMTTPADLTTDVLIIGGGPAGLTAAATLAPRLDGEVLVLDREAAAGGIPRHSDHPGYGIRDLKTFISGPAYARRLAGNAVRAGARVQTQTMVTGWAGPRTVEVTSPDGRQRITARAIILATGARERPRPARLIPGDRPAGVYTTGQLQNLVHLHHRTPGSRAVIIGAELVSWSAAVTLHEAHCRPVLMTSTHHRPESYAAFAIPGRLALRLPVATRTRITKIIGQGHVQAVELEHLDTDARRVIDCDTVVFTGDWIPDNELARAAGLDMDPATRGPLIDTAQATSTPGVFAIGNLTHPVDTADVAALDGRAVTGHVLRYLREGATTTAPEIRVLPGDNLLWISPGRINTAVTPPRGRLLSWPRHHIGVPTVTIRQNHSTLTRRRLPWPASPGRVFRIPSSLLATATAKDGPVTVDIA